MKLLHITNFPSREATTNGGANREEALSEFLSKQGAGRIIVQERNVWKSKRLRMLRPQSILREIKSFSPDVLVMDYPSFPFFWEHRAGLYYFFSLLFANLIRRWANTSGAKIVIDVMDLPAYQHSDLGIPMHMSMRQFAIFDKTVLGAADCIWICSQSLQELVQKKYGISPEKLRLVVNGANRYEFDDLPEREPGGRFRFVYCGSLDKERGVEPLINAYYKANIDFAELHISGEGGEWIAAKYPGNNIVYHGTLNDIDAAKLASQCDMGIIYYPQIGYYQLAYATKLSFYVCNGIPVLCTDVNETGGAVLDYGTGMVVDIDQFVGTMRSIAQSRENITKYQKAILSMKDNLYWDSLYSSALNSLGD